MLSPAQVAPYRRHGYVIARGMVSGAEVKLLRNAVGQLLAEAPIGPDQPRDREGSQVPHPDDYSFLRRDDGTAVLNRVNMPLSRSADLLKVYANPRLLQAVEALYGPDWVPFAECIVIKLPHVGTPFRWHQDGLFSTGEGPERGMNFGIYLYDSDTSNGCLYVVPDSHRNGRVDIAAQLASHGERLPGSIPVPAAAGDVVIHNRNLVHCSYPNHSADLRVTVYFGYHARATVEGHCESEHIRRRCQVVELALAARAADPRFDDRRQYVYRPWIRAAGNGTTAPPETVLRTPYLAQ
jgi:hypothetical protein